MKETLKRVRSSQPFNYLATSAVRAVMDVTGLRSEQVVKHLHRVGTVESNLPNRRKLKLWSRGDDWVSNQIYWGGWQAYEPETGPIFFRLATKARVTLDIGAYVGFFAVLAAHANPKGRVLAFEPLPAIFARLKKNVELNRLENVDCYRAAIGDVDGVAEFFHVENGLPTSSSLSHEFMKGTAGLTSTKVPSSRIETLINQHRIENVDLLKIDTESTEPNVLKGALPILQRDHPSIVCEVLAGRGSEAGLEAILRPLGYSFYLLTPEGPVLRNRIEGHPHWLNYLFSTLSIEEVSRI